MIFGGFLEVIAGPRRHRHRRRAVPGRQAAERRSGAGLRRRAGAEAGHHRRRRRQPDVGGDPAAGRSRRRRAGHRPRTGRGLPLGVPARTGASWPVSTPCSWARCCTGPVWCRGSFPLVGLIGAPDAARVRCSPCMFGLWSRCPRWPGSRPSRSPPWEFSLGVYLIVKGFKPSPITAGLTAAATRPVYSDAAG